MGRHGVQGPGTGQDELEVVTEVRPRSSRAHRSTAGFSLLELLIASVLLVTVLLGIVPLFMRSIQNNTAGNDYSQLSNFSKSQVEELFQLDFDHPRLAIPSGQNEVSTEEHWSRQTGDWVAGPAPSGLAPWTRTTTVRQFNISAIDRDGRTFDFLEAASLDGGVADEMVHLKEIVVAVRSNSGPLGPSRRIVVRTLKAK